MSSASARPSLCPRPSSLPSVLLLCACSLLLALLLLSSCPRAAEAQGNPSVFRIAIALHLLNDNTSFAFAPPLLGSSYYSAYMATVQPMVAASCMWAEMVNATGGLPLFDANSTRIPVQIEFFNAGPTNCPAEPGSVCLHFPTALANWLASDGNFSVIITPGFSVDSIVAAFLNACETSQSCLAVAPLTPSAEVFVCQSPLPADCVARRIREGTRRFQYGFSVLYDGAYALSAHLTLMRQFGLLNVAVLGSSLPYGVEAVSVTQNTIASLDMQTVDVLVFGNSTATEVTAVQAEAIVQQWIAQGVQAICLLSDGTDYIAVASVVQLVQAMKALDWLPGAIAVGGSIYTTLESNLPFADLQYWLTSAQWDWHLKGQAYTAVNSSNDLELFPATPTLASPAVFRNRLIAYAGINYADSVVVFGADAVQALTFIQQFIQLAGAADIESMRSASHSVSVPSVEGQLQLDTMGRTVVSNQLVFQNLAATSRIILSPLNIAASPILPMPTWAQRSWSGSFFSTAIEKAVLATTSLCVGFVLLLLLGFVLYRKHAVIKAATPSFCMLVSTGGLLMLLSVYVTGLYATDASCMAQSWLLTVGFSLMFTALFAKTFRVWRIFTAGSKLKQVRITSTDLLVQLTLVLMFDLILNTTWSVVSPMSATLVTVDLYRPSLDYYSCDTSSVFPLISIAEKALLLLCGIVLTYLCRGVPSRFNETPYLAAAIYNCALLCAFIVPLVATDIGSRSVTYAVQVFGVQVIVMSTLSIVFVPKFHLILTNAKDELGKLQGTGNNTQGSARHGGNDSGNNSKGPKTDSNTATGSRPGGSKGPDSPFGNTAIRSARVAPFVSPLRMSAPGSGGGNTPTSSGAGSHLSVDAAAKAAGGRGSVHGLPAAVTAAANNPRIALRLFATNGNGNAEAVTPTSADKGEKVSGRQGGLLLLPGQPADEDNGVTSIKLTRPPQPQPLSPVAAQAELSAASDPAGMSTAALESSAAALSAALLRYQQALEAVRAEAERRKGQQQEAAAAAGKAAEMSETESGEGDKAADGDEDELHRPRQSSSQQGQDAEDDREAGSSPAAAAAAALISHQSSSSDD